ncbi:S1 family peptidase [Shewanella sp. GXUN23E]|uniref:S1 family peptidase n=1 Tax=Shewanella sp. GXUN23E TaxID=3422498 RepID=UPI003D7E03C5
MFDYILKVSVAETNRYGTGFVVKNTQDGSYVITCGHVLGKAESNIKVNGISSELIVNKYNEGLDLALVFVPGLMVEAPSFSKADECNVYYTSGFTNFGSDIKKEKIENLKVKTDVEIEKTQSNKIVSSITIYTNESISEGYSGSPLICCKTNSVVGVINIQANAGKNYAISCDHICEFLDIYIGNSFSNLTSNCKVNNLNTEERYFITKDLEQQFQNSLRCYSTQNNVWIEPAIHENKECLSSEGRGAKISTDEIINSGKSIVINAREQHGLTTLAKFIAKEAWVKSGEFFLYLECRNLRAKKNSVLKHIDTILSKYEIAIKDVSCVIVDEFHNVKNDQENMARIINDLFVDKPMIIMNTLEDSPIGEFVIAFEELRKFENYYIWSLKRNDIRRIVTQYNSNNKYIGDNDMVLNRLSSDLDALNVPRTPLNCLTFLKIYEAEFDESPINRTEMIKRVLFLLFNVDQVPSYKSRPDLKDSEYILGYFCERIVRTNKNLFTRDEFISETASFCEGQLIDIETDVIFDILYDNSIIVSNCGEFSFKFAYWVYYFCAHRMHHSDDFKDYILSDEVYVSYPDIIEYYTGIDRRRDNALAQLQKDLRNIREVVEAKCSIPDDFDLYEQLSWNPSEESLSSVSQMVTAGAAGSKLPDEVKDSFADKGYNHKRPLTQTVDRVLHEYSVLRLMKGIQAASKALRNSDYSDAKLRNKLLDEIVASWEQLVKVLIMVSPMICKEGRIKVDGATFILGSDFKGDFKQKFMSLLPGIPTNVINWFQDDIFSKKMGSLISKNINNQKNNLPKHLLVSLMINRRPKNWHEIVFQYINSNTKNSYYLMNTLDLLEAQYRYSYMSNQELDRVGSLIKATIAKHNGAKRVGEKAINKVPDRFLPERVDL